jgi:hypothetical protein
MLIVWPILPPPRCAVVQVMHPTREAILQTGKDTVFELIYTDALPDQGPWTLIDDKCPASK